MTEPPLESKLAFLSRAGNLCADGLRPVSIETHMSWVFLAGQFAYKFKKPIHNEFLDFSTLQARHFYCTEELRLNRRLAPEVYLNVLPLVLDSRGQIHFDGEGKPVEWIIKMLRLPEAFMLDATIARGALSTTSIGRVANKLARFYRALRPEEPLPSDYVGQFETRIRSVTHSLGDVRYAIPVVRLAALGASLGQAFAVVSDLLKARAREAMLVEGHGDLRAEHVCLLPSTPIIDCLEFSRDLRILDRIDEVGFLALECERLGERAGASLLLSEYCRVSADMPASSLVNFYQAYRASLRALLALRHLDDERYCISPSWHRLALSYLDLAEGHAVRACH